MSKVCILAAIVLFWVSLTASLLQVQLATSPVYKLRVPTHRSSSIRSTLIARVQGATTTTTTTASYN